jgi:hypothetical protein
MFFERRLGAFSFRIKEGVYMKKSIAGNWKAPDKFDSNSSWRPQVDPVDHSVQVNVKLTNKQGKAIQVLGLNKATYQVPQEEWHTRYEAGNGSPINSLTLPALDSSLQGLTSLASWGSKIYCAIGGNGDLSSMDAARSARRTAGIKIFDTETGQISTFTGLKDPQSYPPSIDGDLASAFFFNIQSLTNYQDTLFALDFSSHSYALVRRISNNQVQTIAGIQCSGTSSIAVVNQRLYVTIGDCLYEILDALGTPNPDNLRPLIGRPFYSIDAEEVRDTISGLGVQAPNIVDPNIDDPAVLPTLSLSSDVANQQDIAIYDTVDIAYSWLDSNLLETLRVFTSFSTVLDGKNYKVNIALPPAPSGASYFRLYFRNPKESSDWNLLLTAEGKSAFSVSSLSLVLDPTADARINNFEPQSSEHFGPARLCYCVGLASYQNKLVCIQNIDDIQIEDEYTFGTSISLYDPNTGRLDKVAFLKGKWLDAGVETPSGDLYFLGSERPSSEIPRYCQMYLLENSEFKLVGPDWIRWVEYTTLQTEYATGLWGAVRLALEDYGSSLIWCGDRFYFNIVQGDRWNKMQHIVSLKNIDLPKVFPIQLSNLQNDGPVRFKPSFIVLAFDYLSPIEAPDTDAIPLPCLTYQFKVDQALLDSSFMWQNHGHLAIRLESNDNNSFGSEYRLALNIYRINEATPVYSNLECLLGRDLTFVPLEGGDYILKVYFDGDYSQIPHLLPAPLYTRGMFSLSMGWVGQLPQ